MPVIQGQETSVATPDTGYSATYPKTDGELYYQSDSVAEKQLTNVATSLTGTRDDPEAALANLITILAAQGFIVDNTTAS